MRPTTAPPAMRRLNPGLFAGVLLLALAACGGGGDAGGPAPGPTPVPPTDAQRAAAANATAQSDANACQTIRPFYWEVGDRSVALAGGAVGGATYAADTPMNIASATMWLYGAYVMQQRAGMPSDEDLRYLNFRSGFTSFTVCLPGNTVAECASRASNGVYTAANDGRFDYGGGHMQQHALLMGLGALGNAALATEVRAALGGDIGLSFSLPQPAGGAVSTPADYARFLRRLIRQELHLGSALGAHAVCTNPATCASANYAPTPPGESWHYALGHWVEDDPVLGDGAFSSAGAFGFYPWIDASRSHYGVVAREVGAGGGVDSAYCGRLIRKAWLSSTAQ